MTMARLVPGAGRWIDRRGTGGMSARGYRRPTAGRPTAGRHARQEPCGGLTNYGPVSPARLHALIDGVFAIAVTLLVLDLPKPANGDRLVHQLLHAWPSYLAYLVSFVTVGVIWIEHHGMMSAVEFVNRRFIERTLAVLLFVSVIPWPTALAAEFGREGGSAATAVAVLFASTLMLMGSAIAWSWRYLDGHPELTSTPSGRRWEPGCAARCTAFWPTSRPSGLRS